MTEIAKIFDSVTIITLSTIIFTFFGVVVRTCFLSKCKKCSICYGLINVDRDVLAENEEIKITGILNNNNNNSNNV